MSDVIELVLQLIFGLVEIFGEALLPDATSIPDTNVTRICLGVVLAVLGIIIWCELH